MVRFKSEYLPLLASLGETGEVSLRIRRGRFKGEYSPSSLTSRDWRGKCTYKERGGKI